MSKGSILKLADIGNTGVDGVKTVALPGAAS